MVLGQSLREAEVAQPQPESTAQLEQVSSRAMQHPTSLVR